MRIGKYSVPVLILIALTLGTTMAAIYMVVEFTSTVTVEANPKVCFLEWTTGNKKNRFDCAVNIFPSLRTNAKNITYGLYNWDTVSRTCDLRIFNITNPANIEGFYMRIYDGGGTLVEITWTTQTLPTDWVTVSTAGSTKYTIQMNVTATSDAVIGQSSVITVEMKVEG